MENAWPESRGTGARSQDMENVALNEITTATYAKLPKLQRQKRFKIQTGDIRSPLTGPRSCATSVMSVVNLKKEV